MANEPKPEQTTSKKEFNFCGWSHVIVGIPALPIIAYLASMQVEGEGAKVVVAVLAVAVAIGIAVMIDHVPLLRCKVRPHKNPPEA